ncbi:Membrane associated serine protease, rhomboid family [Pustulibacterium marinum]|uniref:Membrane associated serine protease, rhomboid family n=1 Tax=Pustulibacterium marinum TaxID=1224947 RepID=A0A1I7H5U8_9FLAO|nr:rhomboid family intramembrane serine protease [Pustulibacterium marinum]SFU56021.1 Membrane associated serine protease, rhomboid family [Pustulibacterium marinum]
MMRLTETVKHLLIINILFFIVTMMNQSFMYDWFALWFPKNPNFQFWQIITHMFMHGGKKHIFFNMFSLIIFGPILEQYLGRNKFLLLYFASGLGAVALQILFTYYQYNSAFEGLLNAGVSQSEINVFLSDLVSKGRADVPYENLYSLFDSLHDSYFATMVGASGCLFGITAAFVVVYPNMPLYIMFIPIPIKAKYLIGGYFAITLYSAITGSSLAGPENTAFWAHIGGAVIGFITMWYWKKNEFNHNRWN